jgi:hypothetical protein
MAPTTRARALAALAATAAASAAPSATTLLWVNCATGSDTSGSGNASSPWLTLTRARNAVRALQPLTGPVEVRVQTSDCAPCDPVTGAVNFSFPVLELDAGQDSGASPDATITYTAADGAAVRLLGGPAIPPSAWAPYTGSIMRADLGPGGLDVARYGFGSLAAGGLGTCDDTGMELFWNGSAQTLARWPNIAPNGTWQWANIGSVDTPLSFTTAATRALAWNGVPRAWLHGYWSFDWADSYVEIANVTPAAGGGATITVDADTAPLYGFQDKARFMGVNILSELDAPGEYYIDPDTATLYFWPPGGDVAAGEAFLSVADYGVASGVTSRVLSDGRPHPWVPYGAAREHGKRPARRAARDLPQLPEPVPAVRSTASASGSLSYVTLAGLNTYFTRQRGIAIESATGVTVRDLEASCHGHNGVTVAGTGNSLINITVADTGCEAMSMGGGDLATLTPAGNVVTGCAASRYARVIRTYNPGIGWSGVGNKFTYNTITDAPHSGVLGGGALNTFANNTFDKLCYEATDSGAWYAGASERSGGRSGRMGLLPVRLTPIRFPLTHYVTPRCPPSHPPRARAHRPLVDQPRQRAVRQRLHTHCKPGAHDAGVAVGAGNLPGRRAERHGHHTQLLRRLADMLLCGRRAGHGGGR